jgi:hypothetical protein
LNIFERKLAFVEYLEVFESKMEAARAAGVHGLAVKLYEANRDNPAVPGNLSRLYDAVYRRRLRDMGFSLGAWVCPRYKPEEAARGVSLLYGRFGLSFLAAELEYEYKRNGGQVDAARFTSAWRALRPKAYSAVVSYGYPDAEMNWPALLAASFHYIPESFWLVDGRNDPRACLDGCVDLGIPLERVHPLLSVIEGHTLAEGLIRAYEAFLSARPTNYGVGLYLGENASDEDYRLLRLADSLAL